MTSRLASMSSFLREHATLRPSRLVVAAVAAACLVLPAQAQDTIKLGLVAAMSGQSAKSGEAIVRGLSLAIDEINRSGGINGRELARRARQRWPEIKIVFTSGFSEARLNGDAGPPAVCTPLLSKPYRKEDLASAAREALDRVA